MSESNKQPLWRPDDALLRSSHLSRYHRWLQQENRFQAPAHLDVSSPETAEKAYHELWKWSVEQPALFWESIWHFFSVISHTPYREVLSEKEMPYAKWFAGASLNYAEHVFRHKNTAHPAIIFQNEFQATEYLSWSELESRVAAVAAFLRRAGVGRGDRVGAYLPNSPHAIIAALATMSIGAVWSGCSPDFGAGSVTDRFLQIAPKVLFAADGYSYNGKRFDKRHVVSEIVEGLPAVEKVVFIPYLDPAARLDAGPEVFLWEDVLQEPAPGLLFEPLPFDHPLWILFSSGTTGIPKAITHSHGGNLLEHLKYLHLHNDVGPGERFFWFTTTGWMMWNFTLAALLTGAGIVLYDGSPGYPDLNALWALAEKEKITHFGTSAPFLVACMKAGLEPGKAFDLSGIRTIGSTGSPLPPEAFDYVYTKLGKNIWLSSMAGGTDVCTAWVGGVPWRPVYSGEIQGRCLGCAMESWDEDGQPVPPDEVGEMVISKPMPSMPVFFWNDADNSKYRSSYFEHFPGVWRHGDWLSITARDTLVIHGRSDATLNRQGVRIGTAEIYRAVDKIPEISDSMILNLERPDGSDWMPLFVKLAEGVTLDEPLRQKIRSLLRAEYSPRHVPDEITAVPDIPYTISGKKMETPVKKILQKKPLDKAFNRDAMRNPESMEFFIRLAQSLPDP